jgi:hypothetical protein
MNIISAHRHSTFTRLTVDAGAGWRFELDHFAHDAAVVTLSWFDEENYPFTFERVECHATRDWSQNVRMALASVASNLVLSKDFQRERCQGRVFETIGELACKLS